MTVPAETDRLRLETSLRLTHREKEHLLSVRQRLFQHYEEPSAEWLEATLATPEGLDRLESFNAKFSRLQDGIMDKLLPRLLQAAGELTGTAIDNLNRAEQLRLIADGDDWLAMRRLRNLLVHEYVEDPAEMLAAVLAARHFCDTLATAQTTISDYAKKHLGISAD